MTGYASAQHGASATGAETDARAPQARRLGLEIRSVNSRFLDLSFRLPDELRALEPVLRSMLTAQLKRGKVEVRAALENDDGNSLQDPAPRLLQRINSLQDAVKAWLPQAAPLTVADALRLCANASSGPEDWSEAVPPLAEQALAQLLAARAREGERLAAMLHDRLGQLRTLAQQAGPMVPLLVEQQRQRFMERWKEADSQSFPARAGRHIPRPHAEPGSRPAHRKPQQARRNGAARNRRRQSWPGNAEEGSRLIFSTGNLNKRHRTAVLFFAPRVSHAPPRYI
jgi:uncharacterized protein YicC (UPF0701 family)